VSADANTPRPGPDDPLAAARDRLVALLADLARDRDALAAAGEADGVAAYDALIDAARRALNNLDRPSP
jgi:hypothetical protein